jgi:two-component system response regulator MprA
MTMNAPVLLVGEGAVALAARLEASGYRPLDWSAGMAAALPADGESPLAAVLASDQSARVSDLRSRFGSMPILLDVENDSVEAREICLSAGADDFWLSSLGTSDLLQRLRLHLRIQERNGHQPTLLQVADLTVEPTCRQVRRGRRPVALTAREYSLLLLLLAHRGEVLSREQILREVWNDDQGTASNVIEVYVRYLRQKLEEGGEKRLIHTIRGRGYCLNDGMPQMERP